MTSLLCKLASITSIRDVEVFEISVLKTLTEILKTSDVSLYKFDTDNRPCRMLRYTNEQSATNRQLRIDESHEIQIYDIAVPKHIKLAQQWIASTNKPYSTKDGDRYLVVYPVMSLVSVVGYVSIKMDTELSEAEKFMISSVLRISHNFHALLEENQKDKLTGLLNRKTFDDNIAKAQSLLPYSGDIHHYNGEEHRSAEIPSNFWIGVMDIDHFKRINDTFGHVYGDEVLLLVAQIMRQSFRSNDLLFRFGGEEFVVLLRMQRKEDAEMVLERFRKAVESYEFPQIDKVTISIGAAQITKEFFTPADIIGRADEALYYAKNNGRNRVFFYEDLVKEGKAKNQIETGTIDLF